MIQVDPKKKILIAASVSCMDMLHMKRCMKETEHAGVDFYHYDIVDGSFNNCFILGQTLLETMRPQTELPIEVHLAVRNPLNYIKQYAELGADYIGFHYESDDDIKEIIAAIELAGARPVLTFRAETVFTPDMLDGCESVAWINKLTVNPGFSGQTMQMQAIEHIENIRAEIERRNLSIRIQADGNINPSTIPIVVHAGADILTGGSSGLYVAGQSVKYNYKAMLCAANYSYQ